MIWIFVIFFLPLPDGDKDSRFHFIISFSKERLRLQIIEPVFWFFFLKYFSHFFVHESCQSICRVYLVYQDRVLRLMSHCFFPLKTYRFLLHTNHCQTIPMCTSCVSSSEHNYRSEFPNLIQSQFCWFIPISFFLQRILITTDQLIVVRTSSQCRVSIGRFAFLCALNFFSNLLRAIWEIFLC